jgi:hypothetical protein
LQRDILGLDKGEAVAGDDGLRGDPAYSQKAGNRNDAMSKTLRNIQK